MTSATGSCRLALASAGPGRPRAWLLRGYITDDTYIHLRYAQNLLERGEFSFNPGERHLRRHQPPVDLRPGACCKLGLAPACGRLAARAPSAAC